MSKVSECNVKIMYSIDEIYTDDPTSGQCKIRAALQADFGIGAGRVLICTFMRGMVLYAIHPGPRTIVPNAMQRKYPTFFGT